MSLDKCTVAGPVLRADGTPIANASVTFRLSHRDRDGDVTILAAPVTVATDEGGNLTVDLWPNARGLAGTIYTASIAVPGAASRTIYPPIRLVVPDEDTASFADIQEGVPPASVSDAIQQVALARQARDRAIEASDAAEGYRDETEGLRDAAAGYAGTAEDKAGEATAAASAAASSAGEAAGAAGIATTAASTATDKAGIAAAAAQSASDAADAAAGSAGIAGAKAGETKALHDEVMPLAAAVTTVSENIDAVGTVAGLADEIAALVAIALDIETTAANIEAIRDVLTAAQTVTDVLASAAKLVGGNALTGDQIVNGKAAIGDSVNQTRLTSGTPGNSSPRPFSLIDTSAAVRIWRQAIGSNAAVVEFATGTVSDIITNAGINWWDFGLSHSPERFLIRRRTGNVAITYVTISATGNMAVGDLGTAGADAHASAQLEIRSTTKGLLPPRMTTAQRDAIASPAEGLVIYNLTDHKPQFYDGSQWKSMAA